MAHPCLAGGSRDAPTADARREDRAHKVGGRTLVARTEIEAFLGRSWQQVLVGRRPKTDSNPASPGIRPRVVMSADLKAALQHGLVRANPIALVDRPRGPRRKWRILTPAETVAVERALDALA